MVTTALGRLFRYDRDLRWAMIVEAYMDDQINLGKAAEMEHHRIRIQDALERQTTTFVR